MVEVDKEITVQVHGNDQGLYVRARTVGFSPEDCELFMVDEDGKETPIDPHDPIYDTVFDKMYDDIYEAVYEEASFAADESAIDAYEGMGW